MFENRVFGYFAAAAPGLRELVTLGKIRQLLEAGRHDVVVVDAPATGHGLGFLKVPRTFMRIARTGPVHGRARALRRCSTTPTAPPCCSSRRRRSCR